MCLIAFAYRVHPDYPLILAANRDEFYKRPTREAQFWAEEGYPDILAGKDLTAGGTWMGINKEGKWAALTNYRDLHRLKENPPSRGDLVLNYLKEKDSPRQYMDEIQKTADLYNGFNLLVGDQDQILHYSNEAAGITTLEPGVHGVSNALLNTPWPKLEKAKKALKKAVEENDLSSETLFKILADEEKAPETTLPQTGLSTEMERAVSSVFIKTPDYGTRCSTLFFIDKSKKITFIERRFNPGTGEIIGEQRFEV